MKTTTFKVFSLFTLIGLLVSGCGGLGKMEKHIEELGAKVEPEPLIVRGDSVEINVSGIFPPKYFHKKVVVEATPVLVHGGSETAFDQTGFQGEDAAGNYEVIPYEAGKSFNHTDKIAYDASMANTSSLELRISGTKGNASETFDPLVIGTGVITTPYLMQSDDKFIMSTDKFQRILNKTMEATINYAYNSSNVTSGELRDEDIDAMKDFIKLAASKDSLTFTGTAVEAYASPEGEITLNENLADERAESANAVVAAEMKRQKISPENPEAFFGNDPKGEDWEGFKDLMSQSSIADKELILRVLEMYSDKNKREQEIKNIAKTYKEIEKEILPALRRSQIDLNYDVVGYSDAQLKDLSVNNPDILTVEELLYAATLTDDINQQLSMYKAAERNYPADYRAINNVGVIYMVQNKINDAASQFEKAVEAENNPVTLNNLGAVARLKGDRELALERYAEAAGAGPEVSYNKGLVHIQNGDYSSAVSSMSGNNTFNMALAKMLNGDTTGAKTTMDNSGDESAHAYYLRAVIAARMNNSADVLSNLGSAVGKDGTLGAKAKADLEFRNFKTQFTF
jgi:tetratricopeptide (TPR) repeat protein